MNTPAAPLPFQAVLILVDAEQHAAVDRRALRDMGVAKMRIFTSGLRAVRVLAGQDADDDFRPDIVLCHSKTADMNAYQFAEMVRMHPRLVGLPLLLVTHSDTEATRIDAVAAGFSGVLARPYSHEGLYTALRACCTSDTRPVHEAEPGSPNSVFHKALRRYESTEAHVASPDEAFQQGLVALQERHWDKAIHAFQRALHAMTLKGESELGLAAAWRGKGDMVKYRHYLNEASHTFTRAMQWHKARAAYAQLLRNAPNAPSPFLNVTESLIRAGRFEEAAQTLVAGYDMSQQGDMAERLAQAYGLTENPEECLKTLRVHLHATPLADSAAQLDTDIRAALHEQTLAAQARRREIQERKKGIAPREHGEHVAPEEYTLTQDTDMQEERTSFFANVPVLGDALTVARVTWEMLRKSGG